MEDVRYLQLSSVLCADQATVILGKPQLQVLPSAEAAQATKDG